MHMQGEPCTMQRDPQYQDVVAEVRGFLEDRVRACTAAGIAQECILLDPGLGFGKTDAHNLRLIAELDALQPLGRPVLVGVSRKSTLGRLLGLPPERRLNPGLAAAAVAVWLGAAVVRTHDVAATVEAVRMSWQIRQARTMQR